MNGTKKTKKLLQPVSRTLRRTKITKYLKLVCPKSSECIAFGKENDRIRAFFNQFTDFKYVEKIEKRSEVTSRNGFIHEIKYKHNEYVAYAILKSINMRTNDKSLNGSKNPDNLIYEYLVGRFINKITLRFSCFVQTYGLFFYKDDAQWSNMKKIKTMKIKTIKTGTSDTLSSALLLEPETPKIEYELIQKSCTQYKHAAILLQDIHDPLSLFNALKSEAFLKTELLQTLYQVYYPLAAICNYFTHYDLHTENVLLYRLDPGKYVTFHYRLKDGSVFKLRSQYVSKVIDYGRSFFVDADINSKVVQKTVCAIPDCTIKGKTCGVKQGYAWLNPTKVGSFSTDYYITSNQCNISHDLRLLADIRSELRGKYANKYVNELGGFMDDLNTLVKYGVGIKTPENAIYGTKENRVIGFPELRPEPDQTNPNPKTKSINNVVDAETWLFSLLQLPTVKSWQTTFYSDKTKIGDIYMDPTLPARFTMV